MYMVHTSALPFKDNRLRSQATTHASTLARTSNQFRSIWRRGPNHTPRMRTGPSLQRRGPGRGTLPLQAPNRKPSLLSKLTLAPATFSYLVTASFTATMSRRLDTKTVISSVNVEIFARTLLLSKIPRRARWAPKSPRTPPVHLHHRLWVMVQNADTFVELRFESGGLQNCRQEPMVHPIEGLGLI